MMRRRRLVSCATPPSRRMLHIHWRLLDPASRHSAVVASPSKACSRSRSAIFAVRANARRSCSARTVRRRVLRDRLRQLLRQRTAASKTSKSAAVGASGSKTLEQEKTRELRRRRVLV